MRAQPAASGPELEGSMNHHAAMESGGSSADPGGHLSPLSRLPLRCLWSFSDNIITVFMNILYKTQATVCSDESALKH